jgi:anthranilate phosphoribosyltransferase
MSASTLTTADATQRLRTALESVLAGRPLERTEARALLFALADREAPGPLKAGVLTALRARGETATELAGLAEGMRELALGPVRVERRPLVDTCGTGGDGSNGFNLSTAAALVASSLGVSVAKHGNRAQTSRCGSADLIEALGLPVEREPAAVARRVDELGFAFLFAPAFHPATAGVADVRRALGVRTVFNLLGPLTNPARPTHQLAGAADLRSARLLAEAFALLGVERAFVVHGADGWDEATPAGPFRLFDVSAGSVCELSFDPGEFGLSRSPSAALVGGDARANAARLESLFAGEGGPLADAVALNAALVALLVERAREPQAAAREALDAMRSGRTRAHLELLRSRGGAP